MKITAIFDQDKLFNMQCEIEQSDKRAIVIRWLKRFLDEELRFEGGWPVMTIASLQSATINPRIAMAVAKYRAEFLTPRGTTEEHQKRERENGWVKELMKPVAHWYRPAFEYDRGELVETEIHTVEAADILDLKYAVTLVLQSAARITGGTGASEQTKLPGKVNE